MNRITKYHCNNEKIKFYFDTLTIHTRTSPFVSTSPPCPYGSDISRNYIDGKTVSNRVGRVSHLNGTPKSVLFVHGNNFLGPEGY